MPADGKKRGTIPHPFGIEPPHNNNAHFHTGDEFHFDLLLFGKAIEYVPYCIFAFDQMGQTGIGKRISGRRAAFLLKEVVSHPSGKTIYSSEDKRLLNETLAAEMTLPAPVSTPVSNITVRLETPLRLKQNNHLTADLSFETLIRAALRRISSLFTCYGSGEPDIDYRGMVERARNVEIAGSKLYWFDWERYSNRQETRMMLGGLLGSVTYSGDLTEFMPLLRLCEEVHLGKQTTFGLGKIKIEY